MKELALNILDVAKNSVKAGADRIVIRIEERDGWRTLSIIDNGCGMPPEFVATVTDPFTTPRTTRSVGMGNAMTAIGGDMGSLTFNPAGSAVASYSQFSITPGITFSSASALGTVLEGDTAPIGFGDQYRTGYLRTKLPNLSFITTFNTGKRHGIKRYSVVVRKRQRLVHHRAQVLGTGAALPFSLLVEDALPVLRDSYRTDVCTRFYM